MRRPPCPVFPVSFLKTLTVHTHIYVLDFLKINTDESVVSCNLSVNWSPLE